MPDEIRVLVIDDEAPIRRAVSNALVADGLSVSEAGTAREGLDLAAAERPALIILDLGLPDGSGINVCRDLRGWCRVPIIVLSARHSDSEKVALLDAGADAYVTKPFSASALQARVRAQLRRAAAAPADGGRGEIEINGLRLDLARRSVGRGAREIHLTPTEWDLLRELVRHAGRTLTHRQLFAAVWPHSGGDAQAYLRVHISNLRGKIEVDPVRPHLVLTEPGVGYRFRSLD
ncbi:MAG: response regulator [Gemmatimonadetes bacterium]|nr:response regulator [Gemmatimonadota bacterium]